MNKILVLQIQDRTSFFNIKCIFTFDKILKQNYNYNSEWLNELVDPILEKQLCTKEDYIKWINNPDSNRFDDKNITFDKNKVIYKPSKSDEEFFNSQKTFYILNDYKCVEYNMCFHRYTKHSITPICVSRINKYIYENGIYIFDECIENNSITIGAIEYLKDLKQKVYQTEETNQVLMWISNITNTLKTLVRWHY